MRPLARLHGAGGAAEQERAAVGPGRGRVPLLAVVLEQQDAVFRAVDFDLRPTDLLSETETKAHASGIRAMLTAERTRQKREEL